MHLGYVILYADDVSATVSFYQRAFGLDTRFVQPSGDYAEMETGATALGIVSRDFVAGHLRGAAGKRGAPSAEIGIVVEDVAAAVERAVGAGAEPLSEPAEMPWGQTIAYVADPNGFPVELCSAMSP